MSIMDTVLALRPKKSGSRALREAIERASAKQAELEDDVSRLGADRDAMLFAGTAKAMELADVKLSERTEELRRVQVMLVDMQARLEAEVKREADELMRIASTQKMYDDLAAQFAEGWKSYSKHAEAIADLMRLAERVRTVGHHLSALTSVASERGNLGFSYSLGFPQMQFLFDRGDRTIFDLVSLPAPDGTFCHGGNGAIWMTAATARRFSDMHSQDLAAFGRSAF